jgi:dephospho-CoA kinase
MLVVGLTGGVGSGKTVVSQVLKEEGAHVIDADEIAREVVRPRGAAWRELRRSFGREVFGKDGSIDRKRLAERVFADPAQRRLLNRVLHPRIKREMSRRLKVIRRKDPAAIVVIDAALLVETGSYREMDKVIVVLSTEAQQIERLRRRGTKPAEARKIISSQISAKERLKVADFVIRNEGSLEEAKGMAREVFRELERVALEKRGGGDLKSSFPSL